MILFNIVDKLLNMDTGDMINPFYCDTDSLFLTLPVSLEKQPTIANDYIKVLQDTINNEVMSKFLHIHNIKIREKEKSPLLIADFKNEFMIKSMILYSKKRYISVIIKTDKTGKIYYDIDIKGVEGKRATNAFVKVIVDDLIEYLKKLEDVNNVYDRSAILNEVMVPYRDKIFSYANKSVIENIEYFSMPVNVNKHIKELKNVAGYYKGTVIFDITGEKTWEYSRGKGKWLRVKLKDESFIPQILSNFEAYPQIKTAGKKTDDLIRDITIPDEFLQQDNDVVNKIFKTFTVDYETYYDQLLKKISLLYRPFDIPFCEKLNLRVGKNVPQNFIIVGQSKLHSLNMPNPYYVELVKKVKVEADTTAIETDVPAGNQDWGNDTEIEVGRDESSLV